MSDQQLPIGSAASADAAISGQEVFGADTTSGATGTDTAPNFTLTDPGATQHQSREQQLFHDLQDQMTQAYEQLWGMPPPPGYVASAIRQGENLVEFISRERHKPEYSDTHQYADRGSDLASLLASTLGIR